LEERVESYIEKAKNKKEKEYKKTHK